MHASLIALPLVAGAALYGRGTAVLWANAHHRGVHPWRVASVAAGLLVVALALLSPLHEASEQLFSAHMIQHELLMIVAAPLLVLGKPGSVLLRGLPRGARLRVAGASRSRAWQSAWHFASRPFDAWLIHGVAIWLWHVPALFQATLDNDAVHALQHVSFTASALLFWWAIIYPRRRASLGMSVVYLFTTAVHTAVLGALMTFARRPWYPAYAAHTALWGLSPMEDQQLAGMIMWIPASIAYLVAALLIVRTWMERSEGSVARDQHASGLLLITPRTIP